MSNPINLVCPACGVTNRIPAERISEHPKCGKCSSDLFNGHPTELSGANFSKHIARNDIPVLVDFWAPWCGPCKAIGPIVEEIAGQYKDSVKIMKLNVDDNQKMASHFGVLSIPTLILFKEGKVLEKIVGLVPKARLEDLIKKAL